MIITLTAGHSDTDPGAIANGLREADLAEDLRNRVAEQLRLLGHEVRTDGAGLINLSLREAIQLIAGSAIAVELHFNAGQPTATGVEVVSLERHKYRAQHIAHAVATALGLKLRREKGWMPQSDTHRGSAGFVGAGGLIVETCFISNPSDVQAYQDNIDTLSHALAAAIEFAAQERA